MAGDTRARVLEVAQRRFIEQGYEGTSLREIADELGFTKAALYYHFQSKDQILAALLEPADQLINALFERLEVATGLEDWATALGWVIDAMDDNLDFFRLVQRNRNIVASKVDISFMKDHDDMHDRVEKAVANASSDLQDQIKMVAALGAVTGFDDWAPTLLATGPPEEIKAGLRGAVDRILGVRSSRRPSAPKRA